MIGPGVIIARGPAGGGVRGTLRLGLFIQKDAYARREHSVAKIGPSKVMPEPKWLLLS